MDFPLKTGAAGEPAHRVRDPAGVRRRRAARCDESARQGARAEPSSRLVRAGDAAARLGATTLIHRGQGTPRPVGCSSAAASTPTSARSGLPPRSLRRSRALRSSGTREALTYLAYGSDSIGVEQAARQSVEAARAQVYRFDELKSRREPPPKLARLGIGLPAGADKRAARRGIQVGTAIANGTDLARRSRQPAPERLHADAPRGSRARAREALPQARGQGARASPTCSGSAWARCCRSRRAATSRRA